MYLCGSMEDSAKESAAACAAPNTGAAPAANIRRRDINVLSNSIPPTLERYSPVPSLGMGCILPYVIGVMAGRFSASLVSAGGGVPGAWGIGGKTPDGGFILSWFSLAHESASSMVAKFGKFPIPYSLAIASDSATLYLAPPIRVGIT